MRIASVHGGGIEWLVSHASKLQDFANSWHTARRRVRVWSALGHLVGRERPGFPQPCMLDMPGYGDQVSEC